MQMDQMLCLQVCHQQGLRGFRAVESGGQTTKDMGNILCNVAGFDQQLVIFLLLCMFFQNFSPYLPSLCSSKEI